MPTQHDVIKRIYDLPKIPQVVKNLIENLDANGTDAERIAKDIKTDPVIAAKVLRLANSARYGAGRNIASLDSAIIILGTDALKTLVVASAVVSTMKNVPGLDMRQFWRSSFMTANFCKQIARGVETCDPEIAFTCGMLHNIGIPLLCITYPEAMTEIQQQVSEGVSQVAAERGKLGFDNNDIGAHLAETWKFPRVISEAIKHQCLEVGSEGLCRYAACIQLAVWMQAQLEQGEELKQIFTTLPEKLSQYLALDTFKVFGNIEKLLAADDDIDSVLAA